MKTEEDVQSMRNT